MNSKTAHFDFKNCALEIQNST